MSTFQPCAVRAVGVIGALSCRHIVIVLWLHPAHMVLAFFLRTLPQRRDLQLQIPERCGYLCGEEITELGHLVVCKGLQVGGEHTYLLI